MQQGQLAVAEKPRDAASKLTKLIQPHLTVNRESLSPSVDSWDLFMQLCRPTHNCMNKYHLSVAHEPARRAVERSGRSV